MTCKLNEQRNRFPCHDAAVIIKKNTLNYDFSEETQGTNLLRNGAKHLFEWCSVCVVVVQCLCRVGALK